MSTLRQWLTHPVTVRVAQLAVGAIFLASGLAKIGDIGAFAQQVHNFRLSPVFAENLIAMSLPWIELMAALALLLKVRPRSAALITSFMMVVFTVAVAVALSRGLDFECGCFGTGDATRVGWTKLFQNVGMLGLSLIALVRSSPSAR